MAKIIILRNIHYFIYFYFNYIINKLITENKKTIIIFKKIISCLLKLLINVNNIIIIFGYYTDLILIYKD